MQLRHANPVTPTSATPDHPSPGDQRVGSNGDQGDDARTSDRSRIAPPNAWIDEIPW